MLIWFGPADAGRYFVTGPFKEGSDSSDEANMNVVAACLD
jgi:hypothetical protein